MEVGEIVKERKREREQEKEELIVTSNVKLILGPNLHTAHHKNTNFTSQYTCRDQVICCKENKFERLLSNCMIFISILWNLKRKRFLQG